MSLQAYSTGGTCVEMGALREARTAADFPETMNGRAKEEVFSVDTLKRWARDYYDTVRGGDMVDEKRAQ